MTFRVKQLKIAAVTCCAALALIFGTAPRAQAQTSQTDQTDQTDQTGATTTEQAPATTTQQPSTTTTGQTETTTTTTTTTETQAGAEGAKQPSGAAHRQMPATASPIGMLLLAGLASLAGGAALRKTSRS